MLLPHPVTPVDGPLSEREISEYFNSWFPCELGTADRRDCFTDKNEEPPR
jgi:hypothetical protein